MKSLLNIQEDIRKLESNVLDITESIKNINSDIEALRNSSSGAAIDFSKIEILARQLPFGEHPLRRLNEGRHCQIYLEMLLTIVRLDPDWEMAVNRMVFIQWLQIQSEIDWSLEDLYKDCFEIDRQSYYELASEIPSEYREYFIVDAMIIGNIARMANLEIYGYIADLVTILGIDSEKLKSLAVISRIALSQTITGMDREQFEMGNGSVKKYGHYFRSNIAEQITNTLRTIAVELPEDNIFDLKWIVTQQQKVNAGDLIAVFQRMLPNFLSNIWNGRGIIETEEIKAPASGTIFLFKDNHIYYAVLSSETDNMDSIKAWVKARRKQADT